LGESRLTAFDLVNDEPCARARYGAETVCVTFTALAALSATKGEQRMARKATATSGGSSSRTSTRKAKTPARARSSGGGERSSSRESFDPVDALVKLLQSPLVIDLLAVGATAALAAITETRSSRAQPARGDTGKTMKAAGKAAAAAIGRRLATEFEEIKAASKDASRERKTRAGAEA
jgi:hypothetical protein